jgi:hypothetical protein
MMLQMRKGRKSLSSEPIRFLVKVNWMMMYEKGPSK